MKNSNVGYKSTIDKQTLLLLGIFTILMVFFGFVEDSFLTNRSISSMAIQLPEMGILSLAMMITVMIGGINLSVNATANLSAVLAGLFVLQVVPQLATDGNGGALIVTIILVALLVGVLTGVFNGFLVAYLNVPPILATLASMTVFTGIGVGLTKGQTVTGFPDALGMISSQSVFGIPLPFFVFVGVSIVTHVLLKYTTFGFKTRMLGTNPTAAKFSGINNKSITMKVYVMSSMLASIAGVLIMSRTMSASNAYGTATYVTLTILIGVLAGVISGKGSVINVFITVLILQVISTGFHMLLAGVKGSAFFKDFVWGILLIAIFIINYFSRSRNKE